MLKVLSPLRGGVLAPPRPLILPFLQTYFMTPFHRNLISAESLLACFYKIMQIISKKVKHYNVGLIGCSQGAQFYLSPLWHTREYESFHNYNIKIHTFSETIGLPPCYASLVLSKYIFSAPLNSVYKSKQIRSNSWSNRILGDFYDWSSLKI